MGEDEATLLFWNEIQSTLSYLRKYNAKNKMVGREFLNKLVRYEELLDHIDFYLDFHFKNDRHIVNTLV